MKIDFSKWATWVHGLFAACIVAGSSTGGVVLTSFVGQTAINWHQLFVNIGISSLIAAFFYLKTSPLPDVTTTVTQVNMVKTFDPGKTTLSATQTTTAPTPTLQPVPPQPPL